MTTLKWASVLDRLYDDHFRQQIPAEQRNQLVTRWRRLAVAALAVGLGLSASCSSEPESEGSLGATKPPDHTEETTPLPAPGASDALASAKPLPASAFETVTRVRRSSTGDVRSVSAVDASGAVLVFEHPEPTGEYLSADWRILLESPGEKPAEIPRPSPKAKSQVIGAAVSARWVVWMETPSTTLASEPWALYAYDRDSGSSRLLVTSPPMADGSPGPSAPGFTPPVLLGDMVYWDQVSGASGAEAVDVVGCRIDDCSSPETVAEAAAFPTVGGSHLYVLTAPRYAGDRDAEGPYVINRLNGAGLEPVKELPADADQGVTGMGASSHRVVVTTGGRISRAHFIDLDTGNATHLDAPNTSEFGTTVVTDRYVAIAEGSGSSAMEIGAFIITGSGNTMSTIGNASGLYSIHGQGSILSWQEIPTKGVDSPQSETVVARIH